LQLDPQFEVESTLVTARKHCADCWRQLKPGLTDLRMPQTRRHGADPGRAARGLPVTVIVTTGQGTIDEAVQAIRMGAYDF